MVNKPLVSPRTRSLLIALNWSDEAREASAKKRKEKAQSGGSWLKTAGKVGLMAGGALVGGAMGAKYAPRLFARGRALKPGENLLGKVLYTQSKDVGFSVSVITKEFAYINK